MYYVYFLYSKKDHKFYTGFTGDLKRRYDDHKYGKVKSTKNRRPLQLVHYEAYQIKEDAMAREKYLKTSDGKRDLKRQLKNFIAQIEK